MITLLGTFVCRHILYSVISKLLNMLKLYKLSAKNDDIILKQAWYVATTISLYDLEYFYVYCNYYILNISNLQYIKHLYNETETITT